MLGLSRTPSVAFPSESWFTLNKDEFYVILDGVLTEMTQCEEQHDVTGCIELIKLLSDNDPGEIDSQKSSGVGGNTIRRENQSTGGENSRRTDILGGNCVWSRDTEAKSCANLRISKSKFVECGSGSSSTCSSGASARTSGAEKRRSLRAECDNSMPVADDSRQRIYETNSMANDIRQVGLHLPRPKPSSQNKLTRNMRHGCLKHGKRVFLKALNKDADTTTTSKWPRRPNDAYQRPSIGDLEVALTCDRKNVLVPSPKLDGIGYVQRSYPAEDRTFGISSSRTALEQIRASPGVSSIRACTDSVNHTWTAVDKSVINHIVDVLLVNDDVKKSRADDVILSPRAAARDVRMCERVDDACGDVGAKSYDAALGNSGVKVERVTSDVKLVGVSHFDVSEMSFKWKSKLLWRMNRDRVPQSQISELCLT